MHALKELVSFRYECGKILALIDDGKFIIGEISYLISEDCTCNIHTLFVMPQWRNKGIAKMLNKELFKYLKFNKIDFFICRVRSAQLRLMLAREFQFKSHYNYPQIMVRCA